MRLYLSTPPGNPMADTKWLLTQRGYRVVTDQDMLSPSYVYNFGLKPTKGDIKRLRMLAIIDSDAVVIHRTTPYPERRHLEYLCRSADVHAVLYDNLPAQCPATERQCDILAGLDLLHPDNRPPLLHRLALALHPMHRLRSWWSVVRQHLARRRRRPHRLATTRPYPLPPDRITTC
jgi:hypothetical protein